MNSAADGCRQVERLSLEAAEGAILTRAQRELISSHLATCGLCRAEAVVAGLVQDYGHDMDHSGGHGAALPLDDVAEQRLLNGIMQEYDSVRKRPKRVRPVRPRPRRRVAALAAVLATVLLGAGIGIGLYGSMGPGQPLQNLAPVSTPGNVAQIQLCTGRVLLDNGPATLGAVLRPGQTVRVRQGRSALKLPAQAAVMLEGRSALRLDRLSASATALTLQRGSLLASVRPRPGRPRFSVQTPAGRIDVTGTVFWVEVTPERVEVAVLRGSVRVVLPDGPPRTVNKGQRAVLKGDKLRPGRDNSAENRAIDAGSRAEAWRWVRALELVAAGQSASLRLDSRPRGALVMVDDLLLGETPLDARMRPGYHRLELRKPGYAPVVEWISVTAGTSQVRVVNLGSSLLTGSARGSSLLGAGPATAPASDPAGRAYTLWKRSRPPWSREGEGVPSAGAKSVSGTKKPASLAKPPGAVTPSARELVTRARKLRAKNDFRGAVSVFRELLRRYPAHPRAHTARVSLGLILLDELSDLRGALLQFTQYLARSQLGALAQEAAYGRIRALRRLGRRAAEIKRLKAFLRHYPVAVQASAARRRLRSLGVAVSRPAKDQMGLGGDRGVK